MKKLVVLTGAGISAESGIRTFRDSDGLWEEYRIEDVATYDAWKRNRELVLDFYNQRRRQLAGVHPNAAHHALKRLEDVYRVQIITQNVDNLHERAGSTQILHLHGELTKARSSVDESLIVDIGYEDIRIGDCCSRGSQLRPHIVWFGEAVPAIAQAMSMIGDADIVMVVGTSLNVYPAAGLLAYAPRTIQKFLVDPGPVSAPGILNLTHIRETAATGVPVLAEKLRQTA